MDLSTQRILVFGGSGAIGTFATNRFVERGWEVWTVSRSTAYGESRVESSRRLIWSPDSTPSFDGVASNLPAFDAVLWAQGQNFNDSVATVELERHMDIYRSNVVYILETLRSLLALDRLASQARLCVISSIWQTVARQDKLSYMITKAALQGLVLSASVDLAQRGHVINAILPGAIDTPMTRANLSTEQLRRLEQGSPFNALPTLDEVCLVIELLCSPMNTGMTGQFIAVDKGFSHARVV